MLDQGQLAASVIDHQSVDLEAADRVTYLLEQTFRYDYASPVEQLRHRLVVLPPARHGNQHLRAHRLEVEGAATRRVLRRDGRGNTVVRLDAARVERQVRFTMTALLERVRADGPVQLPASALSEPRFLRATRLTAADPTLAAIAHDLRCFDDTPLVRAHRICETVHALMSYEYGVTSVQTPAADALAVGRGVCQDYAHIMLALCHLLVVPARYVSGHLLGQGGTHAWVEVLTPHIDHVVAVPFDPCNGVPATVRYLTVATGRDYADVAPTSGSYIGASTGQLTATRRLAVLAAEAV
jgi:transglutaminase-like putative cysteine protease